MIEDILWHLNDSDLSPYAISLYIHLFCAADGAGICDESTRELSSGCGFSVARVMKAKRELEDADLVEVRTQKKGAYSVHVLRVLLVHK